MAPSGEEHCEVSGEAANRRATIIAKVAAVMSDPDAHITNIESAIAKAGVSLQEISLRFGGTRALILAMTSELTNMMSVPLAALSVSMGLKECLLSFGEHVAELCATSHWRGLFRIAVTESIRQTGLAREFHEVGPGRLTQRLAAVLHIAREEGALVSGDPHLLASHFLAPLILGLNAGCGPRPGPPPGKAARIAYVRSLVDVYCRGINKEGRLC
jgi:hypothetical protein